MPTTRDVLSEARRRLGIQESPRNSNRTPIGVQFGWNGVPWCAEYVCVCLSEAGFKFNKSASCTALHHEFKSKGWKTVSLSNAQAGDVVFFNWPGTAYAMDHTGFVEGRKADGRLITLEGNTTLSNGNGGVARCVRAKSLVASIVRPPYTGKLSTLKPIKQHQMPPMIQLGQKGPWVRSLQMRLGKLAVTGNFGPKTRDAVCAFQKAHHLTADGIVGSKTWKALGW